MSKIPITEILNQVLTHPIEDLARMEPHELSMLVPVHREDAEIAHIVATTYVQDGTAYMFSIYDFAGTLDPRSVYDPFDLLPVRLD